MAREKNPEVWLTARSRELLMEANALLPIPAKDSQVVEGALAVFVDQLRAQRAPAMKRSV